MKTPSLALLALALQRGGPRDKYDERINWLPGPVMEWRGDVEDAQGILDSMKNRRIQRPRLMSSPHRRYY